MQPKETAHSFAMLGLRLVLGSIMIAHGWMKVHHGMQHFVQSVHSMGMPGWLAYLSAGAEFGGGILLLIGLLTRVAGAFVLINMLVAVVKVHLPNGLTGRAGKAGYEYPLALAAMALTVLLLGAGPVSADWMFRRRGLR